MNPQALGGLLFHGGGAMIDHQQVMMLTPLMPALLLLTIGAVNVASSRGYVGVSGRAIAAAVPLAAVSAVLSLGAGAIHFAVLGEHLDASLLEGGLFLAAGWFQLIWALAYLVRPTRGARIVGALGHAGIITAWLVSRTVGLPFDTEPWVAQSVGTHDLFATAFQIVLVGILLAGILPRWQTRISARRMPIEQALVLTIFGTTTVVVLTSFALLTG